jgi:predicted XRE-type DNA-binding protein
MSFLGKIEMAFQKVLLNWWRDSNLIKSEQEYRRLKKQVIERDHIIDEQRKLLEAEGVSEKGIEISLGIAGFMQDKIRREVAEYEQIISGDFEIHVSNLDDIGRHLIRLRLWLGVTQAELAKRLDVPQSSVSKDERNEYQGASLAKIKAVLRVLNVNVQVAFTNVLELSQAKRELDIGKGETSATRRIG